jgi:hypothetical protein
VRVRKESMISRAQERAAAEVMTGTLRSRAVGGCGLPARVSDRRM